MYCLQYLEEFMSTRLGVKRTAEVVAAAERTGADGQLYYDIQTRVSSYASRNQLAVTQTVSGWWEACAWLGEGVMWGWAVLRHRDSRPLLRLTEPAGGDSDDAWG